jgi:hypothetical protein
VTLLGVAVYGKGQQRNKEKRQEAEGRQEDGSKEVSKTGGSRLTFKTVAKATMGA